MAAAGRSAGSAAAAAATQAQALQAQGQWQAALRCWDRVLRLQPPNGEVYAQRAQCFKRLGNLTAARVELEAALRHAPRAADLHFNHANLLQALGEREAAEQAYRAALQLAPNHVPSLVNLARMLSEPASQDEAVALFRRAIEANPDEVKAIRGLARRLQAGEQLREALPWFERALALDPSDHGFRSDYGVLLSALGEDDRATAQWQQILSVDPQNAGAANNLGAQARKLRRFDEAIRWYGRAHALKPDERDYAANLAQVFLDTGQITEAMGLLDQLIKQTPLDPAVNLVMGFAQGHQANIEESIRHFLVSAEHSREGHSALSNALFCSLYQDDQTPEEELRLHRQLAERIVPASSDAAPPFSPLEPTPGRLRVGFVSADFRSHPVSCFFAPLLAHFPRERMQAVCYSVTLVEDAVTERLRRDADVWRECGGMSNPELLAQIRADRCDVLVDLAGHTALNRMDVFRARAAPLQLIYMGYPGGTGLPEMDGLIADSTLLPESLTPGCREKILRLDRPWICYAPLGEPPPVAETPCLQRGQVRFGSFNNYPKLSEATIALWAKVMCAVPTAELELRALSLADPALQLRTRQRFAAHGVDPLRIHPLPPVEGQLATLQAYAGIDIALDPLPFNGFTTSCDALWMGVPVITLAGKAYRTRVGAALMSALGEPDLVASSQAEYVLIAQRLAADPGALSQKRKSRRARFMASPLGDAKALARAMCDLLERASIA